MRTLRGLPVAYQVLTRPCIASCLTNTASFKYKEHCQCCRGSIQWAVKHKNTFTACTCCVYIVQYDWFSWIPNAPSTMRKPPPKQKGLANVNWIIESLPDRGRSSWHLGAVWALSQYQDDEVWKVSEPTGQLIIHSLSHSHTHISGATGMHHRFDIFHISLEALPRFNTCFQSFPLQLYLGMYPDEHFTEKPVREAMEKFRKQLAEITSIIKRRNEGKKLPYHNMSPDRIPNSVAVWVI